MASYNDLEIESLNPETEKPPESRIKDADSARTNFQIMMLADRTSSARRAEVQAMLDGKPPLDQAVLIAKGQGSRTNLNFGDAERIYSAAIASMIDLINSQEYLFKVPLKYGAVADLELKAQYEQMLACEATRTYRNWGNWSTNYQSVCGKWLGHGVGIAYFDNNYDWRWNSSGLGDFLLPRRTKASEDFIDTCACRRGYTIPELWAKIKDKETAAASGWNVERTKEAILKCAQASTRFTGYGAYNWEMLESELRSADLTVGARCEEVNIVHYWQKEFDGTVTVYMLTLNSPSETLRKEFLYEKKKSYESMGDAFTFFCFGIGDGYYQGITGLMRAIYPHIQVSNRLRSLMVDAAAMSSSIMLQPESETAIDKMAMVSMGPLVMLPPADVAQFVDRASPNLVQNVTPVLADMENSLDRRAGQLNTDSPLNNGVEKTRYEMEALVSRNAKVGTAQLNLFYPPADRLMRNSLRRLCEPDYSDSKPGGKEATAFRNRLKEKGFPLELLTEIDFEEVKFPRSVGAGSETARFAAFSQLEGMVPAMDAVGRHNFYRDKTATITGDYDTTGRYFPALPGDVRPPMDKQIADLENGLMKLLQPVEVVVNQMHQVHLDSHLPVLDNYLQQVQNGQMDMMAALDPMSVIHAHCVQHLEQIDGDPLMADAVAVYRQALSNASEILWNASRKRQAEQAKMQQEGQGQQQGDEEDGEASAALAQEIAFNRAKLQMMTAQSEQKMAIRQREADQKIINEQRLSNERANSRFQEASQKAGIRDAEAASKLVHQARSSRLDMALKKVQARNQPKPKAAAK